MASVLVIEDHKPVRDVLRLQLQNMGHSVLEAGDGHGALQLLAETTLDAVLLDLNLPGVSGDHLLDHIRRQDLQMPVLVLTGHGEVERAVSLMRRGAFSFLVKPVSHRLLRAELERALDFHRLSREKTRLERESRLYREEVRRLAGEIERRRKDYTLSVVACALRVEPVEYSAEEMAGLIERFDLVESILREEGGAPRQFLGDELIGVFGLQDDSGSHPSRAARAAWRIRESLGSDVHLAAHTGPVLLSGGVVDYTGVDDLVLTMTLLLHLNTEMNTTILLSEPLYQEIRERAGARPVGWAPLRQGPREVRTYELLTPP